MGELIGLLQLALPKPSSLASGGPASALALALHALMIRGGFSTLDAKAGRQGRRGSSYAPPEGWLQGAQPGPEGVAEFTFTYGKDGKAASSFSLVVSAHAASGRCVAAHRRRDQVQVQARLT